MEAIVLLGGAGTRLRPLTYDTPKPMLPIVERPIVARIVEWLARYGVGRVIFSLGYRPDAFLEAFPDGLCAGARLEYAIEPQPLDTAGAIAFAAGEAGLREPQVLVINGDVLTDLDLGQLLSFHGDVGASASIALTPVDNPSAYGVVVTDDAGKVSAFVEKPPPEVVPTNLINAGTYVLSAEVIASIPSGRRVSIEREIFPALVASSQLYAMASSAYWLDTGTPADYLRAQADILSGRRPLVVFPESTEISPRVRLAPGATVGSARVVEAFIGRDAAIGDDADVTGSVVGAGAVVGAGVCIKGSVVLPGARLEAGVWIEDSVVGAGASVGANAVVTGISVLGNGAVVAAGERLDSARVPV